MIDAKTALQRSDCAFAHSLGNNVRTKVPSVLSGIAAGFAAIFTAGGTIGNYTSTVTAVDITEGAPGILSAYGMLVDMMIYMANEFFLQSALGQLYIAMACVLFTFILVKSLLRHSSGGRRR